MEREVRRFGATAEADPPSSHRWRGSGLGGRNGGRLLTLGTAYLSVLPRPLAIAVRYLSGLGIIALIVISYRHAGIANETTVGFTLLLAILCTSAVWGLGVAVVTSIFATLCYDYFFLPPVGQFNISDYRDWVALISFFVTAAFGSYLSAWARREAKTADERRREMERLYDFSRRLLGTGDPTRLLAAIPQDVVDVFETGPVTLSFTDRNDVYSSTPCASQNEHKHPQATAERCVDDEGGVLVLPLRAGERDLGILRIAESGLSQTTLEAIAALIVGGIERARAIERAAKMEAARETEQLKSVFLDALAHDFKTPLTSIKGSASALLADLGFGREEKRELLTLIDEECDRMNKLMGSASEMAKLEAGHIKLNLAPHPVGELVSAALADCQGALRERHIEVEVKDPESMVLVDLSLAKKVLVHLIDNANLYSSPGEPITIRAARQDDFFSFSVADLGPGIEESDLAHIFEKFYRGKGQRDRVDGTGMGLAIAAAIVRAHGGTIEATSRPGQGSVFTFYLPVAVPTVTQTT